MTTTKAQTIASRIDHHMPVDHALALVAIDVLFERGVIDQPTARRLEARLG